MDISGISDPVDLTFNLYMFGETRMPFSRLIEVRPRILHQETYPSSMASIIYKGHSNPGSPENAVTRDSPPSAAYLEVWMEVYLSLKPDLPEISAESLDTHAKATLLKSIP